MLNWIFNVLRDHFWYPSLFWCRSTQLLTPILEPHFGTRFAQEATRWAQESHQELQRPKNSLFKTIKKHWVFTRFWVQRHPKRASRGPRRLPRGNQRAPKPQKNLKRFERQTLIAGRKCLSPAISIFHLFGTHSGTLQGLVFGIIFWQTFDNMLENFGKPILEPNPPKTDQDEPKRAIRSCKEPKNCIYKKVVFAWNCQHFLTLKASQESLKKPKRLPRDTQGAPKPSKKISKIGPKN